MPSSLDKLTLFQSPLQKTAKLSSLDNWMEVFTLTQWKTNRSKNFLLIILFLMALGMEKILSLQVTIKKLHFMIHLVMSYKDLTTPTMTKSKTLLFVSSTHQEKA